jgi:hypothetical protein
MGYKSKLYRAILVNDNKYDYLALPKGFALTIDESEFSSTQYGYYTVYGFISKGDILKLDDLTNIEKIIYGV